MIRKTFSSHPWKVFMIMEVGSMGRHQSHNHGPANASQPAHAPAGRFGLRLRFAPA
jgi:hypothetical protein